MKIVNMIGVFLYPRLTIAHLNNTLSAMRVTIVPVLVTGLVACGGGTTTPSSTPTPAPTPPASATTYLHYTNVATTATATGTLITLDTAAPTNSSHASPAQVNAAQGARNWVATVEAGTVSTENINDMHTYAVVFVSNGVIKKQSAMVATSIPAAVQISSASGITDGPGDGSLDAAATDLCYLDTVVDFQNPDNSVVYYILAGPDTTCNNADDTYAWLRLNTPDNTAPTALAGYTGIPVPIYNTSTLAITGFVALKAGVLTRFDDNFSNPSPVTDAAGPYTILNVLVQVTAHGHLLLLVGDGIHTYDPTTNTLGASLASISQPDVFENYTNDATDFYFVDNPLPDSATNVIQRISLVSTTPAPAAPVVTEASGARISTLRGSTPNRLVYVLRNGTDNSVQSIARSASNATTSTRLYPATASTDLIGQAGSSSTGRVYINRLASDNSMTAAVINDDGSGLVTHADASWNSGFSDTAISIVGANLNLSHIVLIQRNAAGKSSDDLATLIAYDATTHTSGAVLGTVPGDIPYLSFGFAFGPRALLTGYKTGYTETDIFYVDVLSAGSLTRVTDDSAFKQQF